MRLNMTTCRHDEPSGPIASPSLTHLNGCLPPGRAGVRVGDRVQLSSNATLVEESSRNTGGLSVCVHL